MKTGVIILVLAFAITGCKSKEKMDYVSRESTIEQQPTEVNVQETIRDTMVIEEKPQAIKHEDVTLTQGADLMDYCIIVGSFMYKDNAVRLRTKLLNQGFYNSSIMRNSEGMYRVSIACDEDLADAKSDLSRIRGQFPAFRDAWLLSVKKSK